MTEKRLPIDELHGAKMELQKDIMAAIEKFKARIGANPSSITISMIDATTYGSQRPEWMVASIGCEVVL